LLLWGGGEKKSPLAEKKKPPSPAGKKEAAILAPPAERGKSLLPSLSPSSGQRKGLRSLSFLLGKKKEKEVLQPLRRRIGGGKRKREAGLRIDPAFVFGGKKEKGHAVYVSGTCGEVGGKTPPGKVASGERRKNSPN